MTPLSAIRPAKLDGSGRFEDFFDCQYNQFTHQVRRFHDSCSEYNVKSTSFVFDLLSLSQIPFCDYVSDSLSQIGNCVMAWS